ncbi:MAG: dihydropteroate synthase [Phycisphaeraceae bacterium]|nr:dihydropteroate synthase [Phycisphaeraceae bacterium]
MNILRFENGRSLTLDRPRIMGILNVTPDSFSDGGSWTDPGVATAHGLQMAREGANIIDIGGESTRPGSQRINADEQILRVETTIKQLRDQLDLYNFESVAISIDTTLGAVAAAALNAGASIINDVSAGRDDDQLFELAASRSAPMILMHMRGTPMTMQENPQYNDVVDEVAKFLLDRAVRAQAAGVNRDQIMIDPGIGFGKTEVQNLALLAKLRHFVAIGYPVLLGTSRKRFLRSLTKLPQGQAPQPEEIMGATCSTTSLGVAAGIAMFRVHDVLPNRQAADVAWAVQDSGKNHLNSANDPVECRP